MTYTDDDLRQIIAEQGGKWDSGMLAAAMLREREARTTESPYAVMADALDCFWNAALGATHNQQDSTANAVMAGMVEGMAAIATRLREKSA